MTVTKRKKVVLAYSGGLDTSVVLHWIGAQYGCDVIACYADLGQGDDVEAIRAHARKLGASKVYILDLRREFARDFLFPVLRANAVYEGYLLGTAIARPLIAKAQVAVARRERAQAVAHGSTGKGNDQIRFELAYQALAPDLRVIAPWREWAMTSRGDLMEYAARHGIPVSASPAKPYSVDRNLFHVSYEGGILEDPWVEPPPKLWQWTVHPDHAPNASQTVEVTYRNGNPVAVGGRRLPPAGLVATLNALGGRHGVGRVDLVENRYVGIKSRGIYETPGGTILHVAHRAVESLTLDREILHLRDALIPRYAELIYNGYWFAPEREWLQATMDAAQAGVTGTARVRLYKGHATVVGRKAPRSLYNRRLASFEEAAAFEPAAASGFIQIAGLRLRQLARVRPPR